MQSAMARLTLEPTFVNNHMSLLDCSEVREASSQHCVHEEVTVIVVGLGTRRQAFRRDEE